MIKDRGDDAIPHVEFDLEKNDAEQAKRKKLVNSPTSGTQIEYRRALAYIEAMAVVPREDFTAGVMKRYTEALALIGDYAQAYELSGEEYYDHVDQALLGKTEKCSCTGASITTIVDGRPKTTVFPSTFVKKKIYDARQQKHIPLMCCNVCLRLYAA